MKKRNILVVGNWKLNPESLDASKKLFLETRKRVRKCEGVDVGIAPPTVFLSDLNRLTMGRVALCAQGVYEETAGAHTGATALPMLMSVGVTQVIIGHSEVRARGLEDAQVNARALLCLKKKQMVIVCVGEQKRDKNGKYLDLVEAQVRAVVKDVKKTQLSHLVIAYEPIWAIGTGETATPADALEMKIFIQKILSDIFGQKLAKKVRVLYGGSVKPENAEALLVEGEVDGFLVGGASLKPEQFGTIVQTAHLYATT